MGTFPTFLTRNPFGKVPVDFTKQTFDFIDERADGGIDKSLHPGTHFGVWKFNFQSTKSKPLGDCTFGADNIVTCVDHGLPLGTLPDSTDVLVRLETDIILPTGLSVAEYYTPVPIDLDTINLYLGGVLVEFDVDGEGDNVLVRRGLAYDLTGATVDAWVKTSPEDDDDDTLLDLEPTVSSDIPGQVLIDLEDEATTELDSAEAFWDMIIAPASEERRGPWISGRFDIVKLVTHPEFGP